MRRKGSLFIADADTVITSCNGHPLNIVMEWGQQVDLDILNAEFPYEPPKLEVPTSSDVASVNTNVFPDSNGHEPDEIRLGSSHCRITYPLEEDGWRLNCNLMADPHSRVALSWKEKEDTHRSLGFSDTRRDKTMLKVVGRRGDIAVLERESPTDKKFEPERG